MSFYKYGLGLSKLNVLDWVSDAVMLQFGPIFFSI